VRLEPNVTDARYEQPVKAKFPMVTTESGNVTDVRSQQPEKAESPMVTTPGDKVMDLRYPH
jgi:hypothetical protein